MSISLNAQEGSQPLHISNVTIIPGGCGNPSTVTLTAAGGQPAPDGLYTYQLEDVVKTARTATFANVSGGLFLISDAAKNITIVTLNTTPSNTEKISVDLVVLPLADAPGCVTVVVTNPPTDATVRIQGEDGEVEVSKMSDENKEESEKLNEQEKLDEASDAVEAGPLIGAITKAVFPVSPTTAFDIGIEIDGDCNTSFFSMRFPVPLGQGNAIAAFLLRNYCSCVTAS